MLANQQAGALLERLLPVVAACHREKSDEAMKAANELLESERPAWLINARLGTWLIDFSAAYQEVAELIDRRWIDARLCRALARVKKCEAKVSRCQQRIADRLAGVRS